MQIIYSGHRTFGVEVKFKMFELRQEILMSTGSVSHSPNNLSVFFHEAKDLTLACMVHEDQVRYSFLTFSYILYILLMLCRDAFYCFYNDYLICLYELFSICSINFAKSSVKSRY